MSHDNLCERKRWRVDQGCQCGSRAWVADPLPADDLPECIDAVAEMDP